MAWPRRQRTDELLLGLYEESGRNVQRVRDDPVFFPLANLAQIDDRYVGAAAQCDRVGRD